MPQSTVFLAVQMKLINLSCRFICRCHCLFRSLGSTRFFKVAKAQSKEGPLVVKVFVIHDPSLPLKSYRDKLEGGCYCHFCIYLW